LAGPSSRSNSEPCLSQMANTFTPLISLPPSMPRVQAVGVRIPMMSLGHSEIMSLAVPT
jgi:hypothetical protein